MLTQDMTNVQRIIMHVDMDSFFASVEQQANPRLRGKPIAVSGDPKSRTVVAAASKEAKRFGVKSAMTIGEARRLCPKIQFVLGDPDKYVSVAQRIVRVFQEYTPDVEVASIDEAFLEMTGWSTHFACGDCVRTGAARGDGEESRAWCGAVRMIAELRRCLYREVGEWITCSVGVAQNKRLAKLASDFRKPNGLVLVYPHAGVGAHPMPDVVCAVTRETLLASLQLRDLGGIGPRIEERLRRMGIATIAQLAGTPITVLRDAFGVYGNELHDMAMGHDVRPVSANDADPKSMGHSVTLPRDLRTVEEIRPVVEELAERVTARLRRDGFRGSLIRLTMRYGDFTDAHEQRTISEATNDGRRVARAVMDMLAARLMRLPVRLVGISVGHLVRVTATQVSLFAEDVRWQSAIAAMDAANHRHGAWTVLRASLLGHPRVLRRVAAAFQSTAHLRDAVDADGIVGEDRDDPSVGTDGQK
ncbi:DNA polymerase IV [Candidatus Uhrbacteria bacterium]|nr:DNA polymerase IV [Candidatus Uhrbacteria bacterium]